MGCCQTGNNNDIDTNIQIRNEDLSEPLFETKTNEWQSLPDCKDVAHHSCYWMPNPLMINSEEILMVPSKGYSDFLWVYNIYKNEWTKFLKYPVNWTKGQQFYPDLHSVAMDKDKSILYIFNGDGYMIEVDLKLNKFIKSKNKFHCGYKSVLIVIDGILHIIGGSTKDGKGHFIWDKNKQILTKIHDFKEMKDVSVLSRHSLLYISSQKCFLIIVQFGSISGMYRYSLISKQCNKLSLKINTKCGRNLCALLSENEQFIVMFGFEDKKIKILDLRCMTLKISLIKCPIDESVKAVITKEKNMSGHDNMLICGYIRNFFTSTSLSNHIIVPNDIINVIVKWYYCYEMIHICQARYHWKIRMDIILQTKQSEL